jgi:hypothetical protein
MNVQFANPPPPKPAAEKARFLPALAEAITEWFPELGGRALAVSNAQITKLNVPTLPLVMVAFARGVGDQSTQNYQPSFKLTDNFIIEFWLQPERYKKANGAETPFWSYYDYEAIRTKLLSNLGRWDTPDGEHIAYRYLTIGADELAVTLSFGFVAVKQFCPIDPAQGEPFTISFDLCPPKGCCPEIECFDIPENDQCDPCP